MTFYTKIYFFRKRLIQQHPSSTQPKRRVWIFNKRRGIHWDRYGSRLQQKKRGKKWRKNSSRKRNENSATHTAARTTHLFHSVQSIHQAATTYVAHRLFHETATKTNKVIVRKFHLDKDIMEMESSYSGFFFSPEYAQLFFLIFEIFPFSWIFPFDFPAKLSSYKKKIFLKIGQ